MKSAQILRRVTGSGFTMIELLIVIAVLGVLAVAVLSAINPIEQINRGKDTGSRSDAEQMVSAISRFYTNQGYYPWQEKPTDNAGIGALTKIDGTTLKPGAGACSDVDMTKVLSVGGAGCAGSNELKDAFVTRIITAASNPLYAFYSNAGSGNSVYICFNSKSAAFQKESQDRCVSGLPSDMALVHDGVCGAGNVGVAIDGKTGQYLSCLP